MKRLLIVALMAVLVSGLILGGCAQPAPEPAPAPEPTPAPEPAPAPAPEVIELKFTNYQGPQAVPHLLFHVPFCEKVEELTKGRVKITTYPGGALGGPADQYDLVLKGTADIGLVSTGFYPGVFPMSGIIELPMQFRSAEAASATYWELTEKYLEDTDYSKGKVLYVHTTGLFNAFSTKEVKVLEDLDGLRTAAPSPVEAAIFAKLGLATTSMPPPEMYTALERGLIDLTWHEWEGAYLGWKTYELTKYRIANIDLATHDNVVIMNWDTWNSLPADIQQAFEEAGGFEKARECGRIFDEEEEGFRQAVIDHDQKVGNPPIYYLPEDERARWKAVVNPIIDEWIAEQEAAGRPGQAIFDDLQLIKEKYAK